MGTVFSNHVLFSSCLLADASWQENTMHLASSTRLKIGLGIGVLIVGALVHWTMPCLSKTVAECYASATTFRSNGDRRAGAYLEAACNKGLADACRDLALDAHWKNDVDDERYYHRAACNLQN